MYKPGSSRDFYRQSSSTTSATSSSSVYQSSSSDFKTTFGIFYNPAVTRSTDIPSSLFGDQHKDIFIDNAMLNPAPGSFYTDLLNEFREDFEESRPLAQDDYSIPSVVNGDNPCPKEGCHLKFRSVDGLNAHVSTSHRAGKQFVCVTCSQSYNNLTDASECVLLSSFNFEKEVNLAKKLPCRIIGCENFPKMKWNEFLTHNHYHYFGLNGLPSLHQSVYSGLGEYDCIFKHARIFQRDSLVHVFLSGYYYLLNKSKKSIYFKNISSNYLRGKLKKAHCSQSLNCRAYLLYYVSGKYSKAGKEIGTISSLKQQHNHLPLLGHHVSGLALSPKQSVYFQGLAWNYSHQFLPADKRISYLVYSCENMNCSRILICSVQELGVRIRNIGWAFTGDFHTHFALTSFPPMKLSTEGDPEPSLRSREIFKSFRNYLTAAKLGIPEETFQEYLGLRDNGSYLTTFEYCPTPVLSQVPSWGSEETAISSGSSYTPNDLSFLSSDATTVSNTQLPTHLKELIDDIWRDELDKIDRGSPISKKSRQLENLPIDKEAYNITAKLVGVIDIKDLDAVANDGSWGTGGSVQPVQDSQAMETDDLDERLNMEEFFKNDYGLTEDEACNLSMLILSPHTNRQDVEECLEMLKKCARYNPNKNLLDPLRRLLIGRPQQELESDSRIVCLIKALKILNMEEPCPSIIPALHLLDIEKFEPSLAPLVIKAFEFRTNNPMYKKFLEEVSNIYGILTINESTSSLNRILPVDDVCSVDANHSFGEKLSICSLCKSIACEIHSGTICPICKNGVLK